MTLVKCIAALALAAPGVTCAVGLGFLARSTFGYFDENDIATLRQAASQVLESNAPNARQTWNNPRSGNYGTVAALGAFTGNDGAQCKRLHVVNHVKRGNVNDQSTFVVCNYPDRGWTLHPDAQPRTAP